MKRNFVAIMAGGIGSRFWPKSRVAYPKQFIDILGVGKTLLQLTYERFLDICPKENIFIVTNEIYFDIVKEQLPDITENQILCEPLRRNTAPCVAYVSHKIKAINPDANIIVAPSDHLVLKDVKFKEVIMTAIKHVEQHDELLTLGIVPTRPDTGYGYIQYHEQKGAQGIYKVKTFTEKPDLELARQFIDSGDFYGTQAFLFGTLIALLKRSRRTCMICTKYFRKGTGLIIPRLKRNLYKLLTPNAPMYLSIMA